MKLFEMEVQDYFTEIIVRIESISIHDVCESLLSDSRDKETMVCEESSIDQPQIPLIKSPSHKRDHSKLSWMMKGNSPLKSLMSEPCPIQNQYLKQYIHLLNETDPGTRFPFKFVKIYPHTLNLCAQQRFYQGEIITQIDYKWFLSLHQFQSTHIGCYLSTLKMNIQSNRNIFVPLLPADREIMKRNVYQALQELHLLYIFQHKFVTEIENTLVPQMKMKQEDKWAYAQWLYFQLLPKDFDYMPMSHIGVVKKHHALIGECLEGYKAAIVRSYHNIRNILEGNNLKPQHHFSSFLKENYPNSEHILKKYQQVFTIPNFLWAKSCERSRIYYNQQHSNNLHVYEPHTFVPILDLFHHSYQNANITWSMGSEGILISAKRQIQKGQLLYICYNSMPIQTQYIHSGFVDVESECYLDIPIFYNPKIIFDILQYTRNRNFEKIKDWILLRSKTEYQYVSLSIYSVFQNEEIKSTMRKMTKECYEKMINIANCIGMEMDNFKEYPRIERGKHENRKREIKAQIRKGIKEAISLDASEKRKRIKSLQRDLRNPKKQLTFNEEYNLMCVKTILHTELKLLESMEKALTPYY